MKSLLAFLILSLPAAAFGQSVAPDPPQAAISRLSVGFNTGLFLRPTDGLLAVGGDSLVVYGPNATINTSRRSAVQLTSSVTGDHSEFSSGTIVFYAVQYRRTVKDRGRSRGYWTVGGAGTFTRRHVQEHTLTGPNFYGVIRADDVAYHVDAYTSRRFTPPVFPVVGFGTERFISRRLAIRGDVLISFLAIRGAVGFSVPIGHLK